MKNKHFDEISKGLEMVRLTKYLSENPVRSDFSPIFLVETLCGKFQLTKKEILDIVRGYYRF